MKKETRVGEETVTLKFKIAARKVEREAVDEFFEAVNNRNSALPGDPKSRPCASNQT